MTASVVSISISLGLLFLLLLPLLFVVVDFCLRWLKQTRLIVFFLLLFCLANGTSKYIFIFLIREVLVVIPVWVGVEGRVVPVVLPD